ncbi:hypothetical protein QBC34DRAFT_448719 [Podospora aff. communis PSN243]|uniref:Secreted protein n=1 Tax=Podospora aff. communis PSN243 TaxID=3040156 RepID=A0AAV9GN82_9PEZI|nr:hypothetical protein QBC34DRAFT_448719 [Podospora aff. communis PSN243]
MHLTPILLSLLTATTALTSPPPIRRDTNTTRPAPNEIKIASVVFAGSGCPAGSVSGNLLPDSNRLTLAYTSLTAETGGGVSAREARKNCQHNFKIQHPPGWQFSVSRTGFRGTAGIPRGLSGAARVTFYFSGEMGRIVSEMNIRGPYDGDYLKVHEFSDATTTWSPCGAEALLNVNAEVRFVPVANLTETATLSMTSLEEVELGWKSVTPSAAAAE